MQAGRINSVRLVKMVSGFLEVEESGLGYG